MVQNGLGEIKAFESRVELAKQAKVRSMNNLEAAKSAAKFARKALHAANKILNGAKRDAEEAAQDLNNAKKALKDANAKWGVIEIDSDDDSSGRCRMRDVKSTNVTGCGVPKVNRPYTNMSNEQFVYFQHAFRTKMMATFYADEMAQGQLQPVMNREVRWATPPTDWETNSKRVLKQRRSEPIASRSTAVAEASEAAKPRRERSVSKSNKSERTKPTRRSVTHLRGSSTAANEPTVYNPYPKPKVAKKRSSKESVDDDEAATSRRTKRAKTKSVNTKTTKAKLIRTRPSPRFPRNSQLVEFKPVPIVPAPRRCMIPHGFGLKGKDENRDDKEHFTHGIAYYDAAERSDSLLCKDYITNYRYVSAYMRTAPKPYMDEQSDINAELRADLIDWLVEIHQDFRVVEANQIFSYCLNPNTLHLCVNIIDRYCMKVPVTECKLWLVGAAALLVACKHEERYRPEVRDIAYIPNPTYRGYNLQEILDMEQSILSELEWKISVPTAFPFLHRFLTLLNASPRVGYAAQYYLERSLLEHDMLYYRPSEVCCAAVILAINNPGILLLDEDYERVTPGVPQILLEYTGFCENVLIKICRVLASHVATERITVGKRKLIAVKEKFDSSKYYRVASEVELPSVTHIYGQTRSIFMTPPPRLKVFEY